MSPVPLAITEDETISVPAGQFSGASGTVTIQASVDFEVPPAPVIHVHDEPLKLARQEPLGFSVGTRLAGPDARDINALGAFTPGSLTLRSSSNGAGLVEGRDYLISEPHAMLGLAPESPISVDETVYATYSYGLMRLDLVYVGEHGTPGYAVGTPHITAPLPPQAPRGSVPLAHVWRPYRANTVELDHLYAVLSAPGDASTSTTRGRVPRTLAKLLRGEPVTIVCWGDSVTAGGNASEPGYRYVDVFAEGLRQRFPTAEVSVHNVSVGGSNSANWLFPDDYPFGIVEWQSQLDFCRVLAPSPDLVTIGFVNDVGLDAATRDGVYEAILARFRAAGVETILITPHFTHPDWMGFASMRDAENREYVTYLKALAESGALGLADASSRWAHLWHEGIPYLTLLHNSVNHPDDRGHQLFAEELWKCFERNT